ncbi:MAG: tetratricopeptide repeat protein [Vicinamibacterales bacterium]
MSLLMLVLCGASTLVATVLPAAAQPRRAPAAPPAVQTAQATTAAADAYLAYLRGRRLEGQGQLEEAERAYREAIRLDPTAAEPHASLANVLLKRDKAEDASAEARAALEREPENGDAHWVLGTIGAGEATDDNGNLADDGRKTAEEAIEHLEAARRGTHRSDLNLLLTLGRLYLVLADYAVAVDRLTALDVEAPGIPQVQSLLARAYEGAGRRADAIKTLEEATADGGRVQPLFLELANLYEQERRWADAAAAYGKALGQSYRNVELRSRQAAAFLSAGAAAEAREVMNEVVKASPKNGAALALLAEVERQVPDYAGAEATAKRLMALESNEIRGAALLAQVYADQGKFTDVVQALAPLADRMGTTASSRPAQWMALLLRLGDAQQSLGQLDAAVATYEKGKSVGPADPAPHIAIVEAYLEARKFDLAQKAAILARSRFPNDRRVLRLQAQVLQKSGQVDEAVALLATGAEPAGDPAMTVALSQIYADAGRFSNAEEVLQKAVSARPSDPVLKFQLGAVLEQGKQYARAEEAFRSVLSLDPAHAPTLNYLGYMLAERGERLDEAIGFLTKAVALDPNNGSYLDSLGWAYYKQNDFPRAKEFLARAAEQLVKNSVVQDHYGELLLKLGDKQGAATAWRRALSGDLNQIKKDDLERKLRQVQPR